MAVARGSVAVARGSVAVARGSVAAPQRVLSVEIQRR